MKKLSAILLVALLGYAGLWWAAAKMGERALGQGALKSESVSISGFPLHFVATLEKPQFKSGRVLFASEEKLQLTRNLTGSRYQVRLPLNLTIRSGPALLQCHFNSPAVLTLRVQPLSLERHLPVSLEALLKDPQFYEALQMVAYKDAGSSCMDATKSARYRYERTALSLRNDKREGRNVMYIKAAVEQFAPEIAGRAYAPYSVGLDVDLDGYDPFLTKEFPENSEMRVNDFSFRNAHYAGVLSGFVKVNKTDIFPYGLLNLKLEQYKPMLEDLYRTQSNLPDRAKLNALILKLGDVDAAAPDVTIAIARGRGADLTIGKARLGQFLREWKLLFADDNNGRAQ